MAKFLIPLTLDEEKNNSLVALMASLEECFEDVKVRDMLEVETDNNLLTPMLMVLSLGLETSGPWDANWVTATKEEAL